jgi:hypothetical protein
MKTPQEKECQDADMGSMEEIQRWSILGREKMAVNFRRFGILNSNLRKFGLIAVWPADCHQPASGNQP